MNILIKPVITEKMTDESEKHNRFGFIVDRRANKLEIKDAVEKMYGVSVEKVILVKLSLVIRKVALLVVELILIKKLLLI